MAIVETERPQDNVAGRRHILDGALTFLLLTFAIAVGYAVLLPGSPRAKPLAELAVAPVVAAMGSELAYPEVTFGEPMPNAAPIAAARNRVKRTALPPVVARLMPALTSPPLPMRPVPRLEDTAPTAPRVPWPTPLTGRVLDDLREPIRHAAVVVNGTETFTDDDGAFTIASVPPDAPLLVKSPGYEKLVVQPARGPLELVLKPQTIKAAYLTYYGVADRGIRTRVLDLVARTELNAVVIDVKGDRGWIPYRTQVPEALAAGAQGPVIMDMASLLSDFKQRGVYTIARIVTFKDNVLANARPDLAVIDTRTGQPWVDREDLAWVDPFRKEVWAYNVAIAREAVQQGFDEVQFDYVRFPSDGKLGAARYSKPVNRETRLPAIAGFLERARRELGPTGAFVAADIFGYTAFNENDTDIGQRIEELAPHVDYLCPMVYPSGYHVGIPGYRNPVVHPYQVVYESVRLIRKRAGATNVRVRPWLQDFRDYAFDRRVFGAEEIRAQIRGGDDGGGTGWMLWNPRNSYTAAALQPKAPATAQ
ncbi:MAG: putative glycoside hydrolase [Candidatus Rokuibacteriota bacterium]